MPRAVSLLILIIVICFVVFGGAIGYNWLDSLGLIPHQEEGSITAQANWFVGESKTCTSLPLSAPTEGKGIGYALSYLRCDEGPVHQVRIRFLGREEQPEYLTVYWKCTRKDSGFECDELSGTPKQQ
jgi:hypothetical protein